MMQDALKKKKKEKKSLKPGESMMCNAICSIDGSRLCVFRLQDNERFITKPKSASFAAPAETFVYVLLCGLAVLICTQRYVGDNALLKKVNIVCS